MWKPIYPPGAWMAFQDRKDNKGLPLMEVRKKYMEEQLLFENYVSSLQQLNVLSPSSGVGGGEAPTPSTPTPPSPRVGGDLCLAYDDGSQSSTLVIVDGGDQHISSTYYMDYEGYNEWFQDRESSPVLIWNGSTWGIWLYQDAVAGIWVEGVDYTNYLGDETTSDGPWDDVTAGGTDPNSPIDTEFNNEYRIVQNPCIAGAGKELEYSEYHIISLAYKYSEYPELVPDYIGRIGYFEDGYPTLYHTGSDFFASQSAEPYYRSMVIWDGLSYSTFIQVAGNFPDITQQLGNQSTDIVDDYNDGVNLTVAKLRIEEGKIPLNISYATEYNPGKGTQTKYMDYRGKHPISGFAEYGADSIEPYLRWDGSVWTLTVGLDSGTDSTTINDASGTYDVGGTIHTVTVYQTNANG